jgi:hypothetical protein
MLGAAPCCAHMPACRGPTNQRCSFDHCEAAYGPHMFEWALQQKFRTNMHSNQCIFTHLDWYEAVWVWREVPASTAVTY